MVLCYARTRVLGMPAVVTKFQPETSAAAVSYPVSCCVQCADKCCFESLRVDVNRDCDLRDQLQELFPRNLGDRLRTDLI